MMKQVLIVLTFALASAFAIPPQVRGPPAVGGPFAGAQNVPRAPAVPLTHPLPPSPRDGRYQGSSSSGSGSYGGSSSSSSGTGSYGGNSFSSVSSSNNYNNNNQGSSYAPTNQVNNYAPSSQVKTRSKDADITILRSAFDDNQDGSYSYSFENSDGTKTEQRGYVKNQGTDNEIFVQEGSYQYYAPDGQLYQVNYISDENGYQPTGAHLPQIPNPVRSSNTQTGSSYAPTTSRPNYASNNNNNYNNNRNRY